MIEDIFNELNKKDLDRRQNYARYLTFYGGQQWERPERQGEKHLTFNYAKVFVDKITSYLLHDVSIAIDPISDTEEAINQASEAEKAISLVADLNDLEMLDHDTEIDAAILGDGCYKVTWGGDTVKITAPDVQGVFAWWVPDDPSQVYQIASQYTNDDGDSILEVWTDLFYTYYVNNQLIYHTPNPYGFIPFIIFPNLREPKQFWGKSDIPDLMETQRELNKSMSQVGHILELSGNPIAVLENIEQAEDIAVRPGAVWEIPEAAKAYLLDLLQGGGIRLHLEYIELLYRILHDTSESPKSAYGRTERDLSGIALEIEMQPLLQKVNRKRLIRSSVYRRRANMILKLLKQYKGLDFGQVAPRLCWGSVLPLDRGRIVADEVQLVEKGVHSRKTAMEGVGIEDTDAEFTQWLEERDLIMSQNTAHNAKGSKDIARESDKS